MSRLTYQDSGVDPAAAAEALRTFMKSLSDRPRDHRVLAGLGPFAACFDLADALRGVAEPVLVSSCDGVGTKALLALEWDDLHGLGQDLVAMNVNDLLCAGAMPLVFLDYFATGRLDREQLLTVLKSVQAGCELADCSLVGGETAEMPGLYQGKHFDLAGFCVGVADKRNLLGPGKVTAGDVVLGFASSGFHSNGYSLVRKIIERERLDPLARAPFSDKTWKELLLAPTHIYTRALRDRLGDVHALAHITGGGLHENLPRVIPDGLAAEIDASAWPFPPLFAWIREKANLSTEEMLSTFNCGVGLIAVAPPENADRLLSLGCRPIGRIARRTKGPVVWQ